MRLPSSPCILSHAVALSLIASTVSATCYYPNGDEAKDSFPCGSGDGAMCCPFQWQCMDNGLCYDPAAKILGRYSCTDDSWDASSCPNFCTYDKKAIGNEAILACSDGRYCCDKNRQSGDCCVDDGFEFIDLPNGKVYATVDSKNRPASPTTAPGPSLPSSNAPSSRSSTPRPTTSRQQSVSSSSAEENSTSTDSPPSSDSTSTTELPVTSELTSVITGSNGPSTIVSTVIVTPSPTAAVSDNDDSSGTNTGLIVGCAVGIPAGLALAGLLFFGLWRRRHQQSSPDTNGTSGAGPFSWGPSGAAKRSTDSTFQEKVAPVETSFSSVLPTGTQCNPVEMAHHDRLGLTNADRPISHISELADTSRPSPHSELEGSPGLTQHPVGAFTRSPKRYYGHGESSRNSNPSSSSISPPVGAGPFPSSPVSSSSSMNNEHHYDDMRAKGAHMAHFGGEFLPPVQEGQVSAGGVIPDTQARTEGGRYIPYRPPQA